MDHLFHKMSPWNKCQLIFSHSRGVYFFHVLEVSFSTMVFFFFFLKKRSTGSDVVQICLLGDKWPSAWKLTCSLFQHKCFSLVTENSADFVIVLSYFFKSNVTWRHVTVILSWTANPPRVCCLVVCACVCVFVCQPLPVWLKSKTAVTTCCCWWQQCGNTVEFLRK